MQERLSRIFILLIGVGLLIISSNINWHKKSWLLTVQSDAKGYYAYLPAFFTYGDVHFSFFDEIENEKYYDSNNQYEYRVGLDDVMVNKYFCGTAIMQTPFFLTAHFLSKPLGYESDGYSKIYIILICVAAIFYLCIGLLFLDKILMEYNISAINRIFVILLITFGTHAFYYTIVEPGMSHIYSFALIMTFLYFSKRYFQTGNSKILLTIAGIYSLIALVRPANLLIIILLPFTAGEPLNFTNGLRSLFRKPFYLLISIFFFIGIIALQPIYYKIATGHFWVDTYPGESFHFLEPHFWDMLFSYKKGLLLYTPLLFLSLTGFYFLWKRNTYQALTLGLFLLILNYVLSCWWSWWYGGSFSSRVYVEYIPLFGLLLALVLQDLNKLWVKGIFITLTIACLALNQLQTYQYRYQIIHWEDMTKEKYWDIFLKLP